MAKSIAPIDKVRASRDGHEFHEAWTARRALQLLMPTDGLAGIAVEGFSPPGNQTAATESVEIADLVLYYGNHATFDVAERVVVLQFKYSIRGARVPFRMADARETVRKFAVAFRDHKSRHGAEDVSQKLAFNLITNRPVHLSLEDAIRGIAAGKSVKGEAKRQANQFKQINEAFFVEWFQTGCPSVYWDLILKGLKRRISWGFTDNAFWGFSTPILAPFWAPLPP